MIVEETKTPTTPLPGENASQGAEMMAPKGRAAMLALYKTQNPETTDEPDDESLFDFGHKGMGERDELRGKYDTLNGANEKLAEAISQDPRFAKFIAMVGSGEKPLYALGKIFGNVIDQLDEEGTENLKKGQDEYSSGFNQLKQNFEAYKANLKKYGEDNSLDDATTQKINDIILDLSDAFMNWDITTEVIDGVFKMIDYDQDKQALSEAEALAIKNKTIDEMKSGGGKPEAPLPDLNGSKQQAKNKKIAPVMNDEASYVPYSQRLEVKK